MFNLTQGESKHWPFSTDIVYVKISETTGSKKRKATGQWPHEAARDFWEGQKLNYLLNYLSLGSHNIIAMRETRYVSQSERKARAVLFEELNETHAHTRILSIVEKDEIRDPQRNYLNKKNFGSSKY